MLINIHTHHIKNLSSEIINSNNIIDPGYFSFGIMCDGIQNINPINIEKENHGIINHKNCIAIGEIGLDKTISIDLDKQKELFIKQIVISEKYEFPIILHCVKSWNEISVIRKEIKPKQPWVFHGFRKTNLVSSVLQSGVLISIGTAILWDNKLQNCIKNIPLDKLFLETDDDTNYSIEDVYRKVAMIKNISLHSLEKQILSNTKNTFRKWEIG